MSKPIPIIQEIARLEARRRELIEEIADLEKIYADDEPELTSVKTELEEVREALRYFGYSNHSVESADHDDVRQIES